MEAFNALNHANLNNADAVIGSKENPNLECWPDHWFYRWTRGSIGPANQLLRKDLFRVGKIAIAVVLLFLSIESFQRVCWARDKDGPVAHNSGILRIPVWVRSGANSFKVGVSLLQFRVSSRQRQLAGDRHASVQFADTPFYRFGHRRRTRQHRPSQSCTEDGGQLIAC